MKEVSKFIPMSGDDTVGENAGGLGTFGEEYAGGYIKTTDEETIGQGEGNGDTTFKVCGSSSNLPAKPKGFFSKLKAILFYEIKVELTPYQQKVEDEINEFLHQEITWQGFKNFLFQDISFSKKNKVK